MAKDSIKIVGFEKDVTLCVAETKGFFSAQGLEITFDQTPNSTTEISGLLTGKWDVAFDNGDNVVAWNEGQGADGEVHDLPAEEAEPGERKRHPRAEQQRKRGRRERDSHR